MGIPVQWKDPNLWTGRGERAVPGNAAEIATTVILIKHRSKNRPKPIKGTELNRRKEEIMTYWKQETHN